MRNQHSRQLARHLAADAAHYIEIWFLLTSKKDGIIGEHSSAYQDDENPLSPHHILWMCNEVLANSDKWPTSQSHYWVGYVHAGMIHNKISTLEQIKETTQIIRANHAETTPELRGLEWMLNKLITRW